MRHGWDRDDGRGEGATLDDAGGVKNEVWLRERMKTTAATRNGFVLGETRTERSRRSRG